MYIACFFFMKGSDEKHCYGLIFMFAFHVCLLKIFTDAQKTMYWFRHPKVLDYEKVKRQAGEAVAAFCRDYKTYNLIPKDANSRKIAKELSGKLQICNVNSRKLSTDLSDGYKIRYLENYLGTLMAS